MLLNSKTEFFWIYFWKDTNLKDKYFEKKDIKKANKEWYNIYSVLNDFTDRRAISDIVWFNAIWIDLDYFNGTLQDILDNCENLLWFYPTKVNKTFKWFHLFFDLDENLYEMDENDYVELYDKINKYLGWDPKMKDITAVLKTEWYIDNKDDRNFEIYNVFKDWQNIWKEELELFLWRTLKFKDRLAK